MSQSSDGSGAFGCLGFILIAVAAYYGLTTDGPSPDAPWMSYAKNVERNRIEWMLLDSFKTKDECSFGRRKSA
ncbi:hypothetical protein ACVIWV_005747 [Bradyrhizobium diazoefficiens]|uniref:hypothetical protein n=1 Tax=Bradyrhizobium diazoefficiens TaxID=1355477 RepID=UPI001B8BDB03|nr:hypothetical protein [Bradyrhizobium diazoefficiens]MBR0867319.1 hypothetical protein [Bradyrhizobium diazoefficiens]MBR0923593.1 hypothetical protein [Bradyrhizobium diazoefficiens]